ncbi:MAG: hypothetical protein H6760_03140 [Candidatus Nomurabacteria bacterium]|nr:MAG: hypothetical protein H6760_03140 [Candidatus Nomurabacteria bacterium]
MAERKTTKAQEYIEVPYRNRVKGALAFFIPQLLVAVLIFIWSVTVYLLQDREDILVPIQLTLSVLILLMVPATIVGVIVCVVYFRRKEKVVLSGYDARSGDELAQVPEEVKGWNWAAAFLTPAWSIAYRVWFGFFAYIPLINYVWWIVMGIKGNEMAWKANRWASVEDFKKSQQKWAKWGLITFLANIASLLTYLTLIGLQGRA